MTQVLMRKDFGGLRPDSEDAYRILNKIGNGASVTVDIRDISSRSGRQHGFFFVLVTLLFESQEYFTDCETFRKCLLVKLGFCELHTFQDGTVVPVAHSVKPSKMPVDEFKRLVDAVLDFAVSVGFDRKEIEAEARRRSPDPRQDQGRV